MSVLLMLSVVALFIGMVAKHETRSSNAVSFVAGSIATATFLAWLVWAAVA